MKIGQVFVISGASGTGKTSLALKLVAENKNLKFSISYTSRAKRATEIEGESYYFVSENKFLNLIKEKKFAEYAKVFNNYYGTSYEELEKISHNGQDVLLEIDIQGTSLIKKNYDQNLLNTIFILPPSKQELKNRLENRNQDPKKTINTRLKQATTEISQAIFFDYIVVNHDFETCLNNIKDIISSCHLKSSIQLINEKKLLSNLCL